VCGRELCEAGLATVSESVSKPASVRTPRQNFTELR
jgi:hypothetical protein